MPKKMAFDKLALMLAVVALAGVMYLWSSATTTELTQRSGAIENPAAAPVPNSIAPKASHDARGGEAEMDSAGDTAGQLKHLRGRVAYLESRFAELAGERRDTPDLDAEEIRAREANLADDEQRIFQENYRRLDDQFVSEVLDHEWSGTMTADLQLAAESEALRGAVANVECRATICRVDVEPGEGGRSSLLELHKALPRLSEMVPNAVTFRNPDGSFVFFLVRAGYEVPGE